MRDTEIPGRRLAAHAVVNPIGHRRHPPSLVAWVEDFADTSVLDDPLDRWRDCGEAEGRAHFPGLLPECEDGPKASGVREGELAEVEVEGLNRHVAERQLDCRGELFGAAEVEFTAERYHEVSTLLDPVDHQDVVGGRVVVWWSRWLGVGPRAVAISGYRWGRTRPVVTGPR